MAYLIDGHNLIGQMPDMKLSDANDEEKLIARLMAFLARVGKTATVVFDPPRHGVQERLSLREARGKLTVVWTPVGRIADDVLRDLISLVKDRQGTLVVTSDAAVAGFARVSGVRAISSQDFIKQLALPAAGMADSKPRASKADADEWAEIFKEPEGRRELFVAPPEQPSPAELKRQRRMEQLKKQTRGQRSLK
ncbi:MAG TPA: NYN domain-containing protein [Thermoflexales bacterium]|nr:NYN domain-containing protein [Thermoflexales bacterium]HQW36349.1 NYN domain-containing protein [Thermoflexales bacterium]HQX75069.1 NYN domain-containing protein [Thermoflexales bacterium]HQZ20823.1 NYN domain-containing protein [Thermoflexales bacterium]HRA00861.1 NYN domain-containing protein [Thermoflexales bacterium]